MKTLLVLSQSPDLPGAVRAALNPEQYRVLHRTTLEEAEPFLVHGLADACVLDMEVTDVQGVWLLEKIHRRAPKCPTIIYTGAKQSDWEEEAYLHGAAHVLTKPVRARMLNTLMERLWPAEALSRQLPPWPSQPARETTARAEPIAAMPSDVSAVESLGVLREFSGILTHSLNIEAMLNQFLMLLR